MAAVGLVSRLTGGESAENLATGGARAVTEGVAIAGDAGGIVAGAASVGRYARLAVPAGTALGAVSTAADMRNQIAQGNYERATGTAVGFFAGMATGMATGAAGGAIGGTLIPVPVVGTAAGAFIGGIGGGIIGGITGTEAGQLAYRVFDQAQAARAVLESVRTHRDAAASDPALRDMAERQTALEGQQARLAELQARPLRALSPAERRELRSLGQSVAAAQVEMAGLAQEFVRDNLSEGITPTMVADATTARRAGQAGDAATAPVVTAAIPADPAPAAIAAPAGLSAEAMAAAQAAGLPATGVIGGGEATPPSDPAYVAASIANQHQAAGRV